MRKWIGTFVVVALAACGGEAGDTGDAVEVQPAPEMAPGVELAAMTQTESGLHILDLEVGDGEEASVGLLATVHYTGWFIDGEKFDSSLDREEPFPVSIGAGRVIAGWE
ncbi:MAG: FKBP-type peptidyl-prolyl cis-trans isomerase, partial [Gemmatimonadetes bacterium]|nr:FKBP-type peptidyl-prolyl cis-trans isomerase [Gemmatimonadota bacterium]